MDLLQSAETLRIAASGMMYERKEGFFQYPVQKFSIDSGGMVQVTAGNLLMPGNSRLAVETILPGEVILR